MEKKKKFETFEAWEITVNKSKDTSCFSLSRQNLPLLEKNIKLIYLQRWLLT